MSKSGHRTIGFCGQYVTITHNSPEAESLVGFLCKDLMTGKAASSRRTYDVIVVGKKPMMSLWQEEKQLYFGDCGYSLAYTLINELVYQSVVDNRFGYAIHAGAIGYGEGAMLLPGASGSGKSTLTTWLVSCGCRYLTDELVIISGSDHRIHAFTRPIVLKAGAMTAISSFLTIDKNRVLSCKSGSMLPHRLINDNFSSVPPPLSCILFSRYKAGASAIITRLNNAEGCLKLIACYVNARNIREHGIHELAALVKNIPVFQLTYGDFDSLERILPKHFPDIFAHGYSRSPS